MIFRSSASHSLASRDIGSLWPYSGVANRAPNKSFERTPPAPRLVIPLAIRLQSAVVGTGWLGYHGV